MSTRRRLAVSLVAAAAAASVVPLLVGSPASSANGVPQCPSEPVYSATIPVPAGPPAAVSLSNGTVGFAGLGSDRKFYYNEQLISETPPLVSPLACLGGQATDNPAVVEFGEGQRALFVHVADGRLYQKYLDDDYTQLGEAWTPVNNALSTNGPAAVLGPDGTLHLFVRGNNGALYHGFLQNTGSWRWESLGGQIVGSPTAVVDGNDILVAATTPTGYVYYRRGMSFAWGPYTKVAVPIAGTNPPVPMTTRTPPAMTTGNVTGRVDMFVVTPNYGVVATSQPGNAQFTIAARVDRQPLPFDARIAVAEDGDGSVILYASLLDRAANQRMTVFTQYDTDTAQWTDYRLAPYACPACAPNLFPFAAKNKSSQAAAKAAGEQKARTSLSGATKARSDTKVA
jgi:hypothetical protein